MRKNRTIRLLCSEYDRNSVLPVLEQLEKKGFKVIDSGSSCEGTVLAVLSQSLFDDSELCGKLLGLIAAEHSSVLPLRLDDSTIPDDISAALYASNMISSEDRDPSLIADRIASALPGKKIPSAKILAAAGAVAVLIAAVFLIIKLFSGKSAGKVPVPDSLGITEDDLEKITEVVIVGDYFGYATNYDKVDSPYSTWENDGPHWYSPEDGHEYTMTRYDDLRFLQLMPNLRDLTIALADVDDEMLPDFTGMLQGGSVWLSDTTISSLDFLSGSNVGRFLINRTGVTDYSPLSECKLLSELEIDLYRQTESDLSAFAPSSLEYFTLSNGNDIGDLNIQSLSSCSALNRVQIERVNISDLSFLDGAGSLRELLLIDIPTLTGISAISSLRSLEWLNIDSCLSIGDYTPISGCSSLIGISIHCDGDPDSLQDASFLSDLPKLKEINLFECSLNDMDFLNDISSRQSSVKLGFSGDIRDYSGLGSIDNYEELSITPGYSGGRNGMGDISPVIPFINGASVKDLILSNCSGLVLSDLPENVKHLTINNSDISDLSGIRNTSLYRLELNGCQYLRSLEGIRNVSSMFSGYETATVVIISCPRLTDYSALSGSTLEHLELIGQYSLPDLGSFRTGNLRLESIPDLASLDILDSLPEDKEITLELIGLDLVHDLSPLKRLHGGLLAVPPHLREQAEELVSDGNFDEYRVEYPQSEWQPIGDDLTLLSLDELNTLPKALLKHISRLTVAGDTVVDTDRYEVYEDWGKKDSEGYPSIVVEDIQTKEKKYVTNGPFTDLSAISELEGLRELKLYCQPLSSLEGIQHLENLEYFTAISCKKLSDVSAVFALQSLRGLELKTVSVSSIQGIQNLTRLNALTLSSREITDLSPLADCDFSDSDSGFWLSLDTPSVNDLSPISSIKRFECLDVNSISSDTAWLDAVSGSEVDMIFCQLHGNGSIERIASEHPELKELHFGHSEGVTDLTPLLSMPDLRYIKISADMEEALHSLDVTDRGFEVDLNG